MSWRVEIQPEVERDVVRAAGWYEARQPGLGAQFVTEVLAVWDALKENPLLHCRRHPTKNIRWRYTDRYPYRVIYTVDEAGQTVTVAAVVHAARHDRHWQRRV